MEYKILGKELDAHKIKELTKTQRECLCDELRDKILDTVSKNGGHLASNLGTVELTVALMTVFDFPKDKIVFDVGHQAYSYKLLTGRFEKFDTLRQKGGISGFPRISESEYDFFDTGHSSTSISAALGMARARDLKGEDDCVIAVIGDGALTGGLAYEALNDLGHSKTKMIVILNDNEMSIDKNVGGMSKYLKRLRISSGYLSAKKSTEGFLNKIPLLGKPIIRLIMRIKSFFRYLVNKQPPSMFEDLGMIYYGPTDGHDLEGLIKDLTALKDLNAPVLFHICTKKGKGYKPAELDPSDYHGVGPFDREKGVSSSGSLSYTTAFAGAVTDFASQNKKVVAVTAAMAQGTGLENFSFKFANRFYDCGIAEEHAVTMAGGLAVSGYIPVVAIYSSFLQRAYDEIMHDVCFMNNHVVFAVDRAGFVGADGHTHNGMCDISYMFSMPNMKILAPRDYKDLRMSLDYAINRCDGPCSVRYPRGASVYEEKGPLYDSIDDIAKPHLVSDEGTEYAIVSVGAICDEVEKAVELLKQDGIKGMHLNLTYLRPIPWDEIKAATGTVKTIFTVEEGIFSGGFGENLASYAYEKGSDKKICPIAVKNQLIRAGSRADQLREGGIDSVSIAGRVKNELSS
ncbi:MAG: 1-deoxy-D-xylulose-5-phosphate synthase [Clostridiales bacterium]|nr:1-deoxy-D-xylulose-5-phosphate synthase [Clostridiales bacterium]